jgi:WhiB family transcriptional regulator, redox-sensing transcriptional regulator
MQPDPFTDDPQFWSGTMPSVTVGSHSWRQAAACWSADPELFFPISSAGGSLEQVARAKAVCAACIVRRQCLQYALAANETHGVWGGMTEEERSRMARNPRSPAVGRSAPSYPGT